MRSSAVAHAASTGVHARCAARLCARRGGHTAGVLTPGAALAGWLRHSEIKHGRIAMAGFVGYCFHANGIKFPFPGPQSYGAPTTLPPTQAPYVAERRQLQRSRHAASRSSSDLCPPCLRPSVTEGMSAPEVWDAIPFLAKLQIIGAIGVFEHISEDKNFLAADGHIHPNSNPNPNPDPLTRIRTRTRTRTLAPTLNLALTRRQALHARRQAGLHAHLQVGPTLP